MIKAEDVRVEGEAFVIPNFLAIFTIPDDRPAFVSEVDTDLIFTPSEEGDF